MATVARPVDNPSTIHRQRFRRGCISGARRRTCQEMGTRPGPGGHVTGIARGTDFRVLGSLEVETSGGELDVGGPRMRTLLALLVSVAGRTASLPTLVAALWDEPPDDAQRTVRTYMSRLRKALRPAATALCEPDLIITRPPGYVLLLEPDVIDAVRFERLATSGRQSLAAGRVDTAAEDLHAALALWRGPAYAEFTTVPALAAEATRLARLRRDAVEDRIDADLATGQGRELIAELEVLTSASPCQERLWAQLMQALYRAGRQTDALDAFRRARVLIVEQSGMEPSPVLTGIHRKILAQDVSLLGPHAPARAGDELGPLLAAGAHALLTDGNLVRSRETYERAFRVAQRLGDGDGMALASLGMCGLWVHEHRTAAGAAETRTRLEYALAAADPTSLPALRLRTRIAGEADYEANDHARILSMVEQVRSADDPVALAEALSIAHHCLLGPDHGRRRDELALELIGVSLRTTRGIDRLMGLLWHTVDLFLAADPHAERSLGELADVLAQGGNQAVEFVAAAVRVMLTIRSGRFAEAEGQALACLELGQSAGDMDGIGWYGAQLVAIRWFQGRLPELLPMLDDLAHSSTLSTVDSSYFAALAIAAAHAGDRRTAASSLARLVGRDLADLPRSSTWMVTMMGVAETAYALDDTETAGRAYDLLSPFAELPVMASLAVACFGSAHHPLGMAAMTTGKLDLAVEHLCSAVQHNLALGHWPAVVCSRERYAQALTLRAHPGDAAAAAHQRAAATEEARALGLRSRRAYRPR
jgi:DNA-binding SARP family transcriptional activator